MKQVLTMIAILVYTLTGFAGFQAFQGTTNLGVLANIKCSTGVTCSKVGDKLQIIAPGGAAAAPVLATATTITAAQCGSTFYNSGAVLMNLPEASTVIGCTYTFITANATNFDINPDDADQLVVGTNVAGDAMRNATLGNSITVKAIDSTRWMIVSVFGTWSDIN